MIQIKPKEKARYKCSAIKWHIAGQATLACTHSAAFCGDRSGSGVALMGRMDTRSGPGLGLIQSGLPSGLFLSQPPVWPLPHFPLPLSAPYTSLCLFPLPLDRAVGEPLRAWNRIVRKGLLICPVKSPLWSWRTCKVPPTLLHWHMFNLFVGILPCHVDIASLWGCISGDFFALS